MSKVEIPGLEARLPLRMKHCCIGLLMLRNYSRLTRWSLPTAHEKNGTVFPKS